TLTVPGLQNVCGSAGFTDVFNVSNAAGPSGGALSTAPVCTSGAFDNGVIVTGSEVQRWGLGVVQEIDSAAMHVFARWQHQELNLNLEGFDTVGDCSHGCNVHQSFDNLDLFQLGGVIFF
ncbi:MAG: hypothetical protein WBQ82_09145, partial [Methyloceanibacter sp.]